MAGQRTLGRNTTLPRRKHSRRRRSRKKRESPKRRLMKRLGSRQLPKLRKIRPMLKRKKPKE